ncbi:MAG: DUF4013 domain-containing protein [Methanomicrobiales archaeon]
MDIGKALNESIEYAKDAVWGKWARWILLIISSIIFPLILGYVLEMLRAKKPAPELENWGKLFIDGVKLFVIGLIYLIPVFIVMFIFYGAGFFAFMTGSPMGVISGLGFIGTIITAIVFIIVALVEVIGIARFARMGQMGEAFNFTAILDRIGKIGWGSYIIALIIVGIVACIIEIILRAIPFIGWLLLLIVAPALIIFIARYFCLVYDSVPAKAPPAP